MVCAARAAGLPTMSISNQRDKARRQPYQFSLFSTLLLILAVGVAVGIACWWDKATGLYTDAYALRVKQRALELQSRLSRHPMLRDDVCDALGIKWERLAGGSGGESIEVWSQLSPNYVLVLLSTDFKHVIGVNVFRTDGTEYRGTWVQAVLDSRQ